MKTISFHTSLVPFILSKEKTITWRLFDDKDLSVSDELIFIVSDTRKEFARAIIESVTEKQFKDVNEKDFQGHENYNSEEEMYITFKKYYPNRIINKNTKVKIIKFKLI